MPSLAKRAAGGVSQLKRNTADAVLISRMKGHEDDGMFFGQEEKSVSYFYRHDP